MAVTLSKPVLGVTAALFAATLVTLLALRRKKSSVPSDEDEDEDDEDDEDDDEEEDDGELTPDKIKEIFDDLSHHMQGKLQQLSMMIQQVKSSGQHIPDEQLLPYMKQEFEATLQQYEEECYSRFGTDESSFQSAVKENGSDPKVKKAIFKLRSLHATVDPDGYSARIVASAAQDEAPSDMTVEKFLPYIDLYFDALTHCMATVAENIKEENDIDDLASLQADDLQQVMAAVQQRFAQVSDAESAAALEEQGMTVEAFQLCMQKFKNEKILAAKMQECQYRQQTVFHNLGLR